MSHLGFVLPIAQWAAVQRSLVATSNVAETDLISDEWSYLVGALSQHNACHPWRGTGAQV